MVVDPEGGAQPCCFASGQVGSLEDHSLDEIWNGTRMVRLRGAIVDGFVDPICRNAGCSFVRETEAIHGIDAYDLRCPSRVFVPTTDLGRTGFCVAGWSVPERWGVWSDGFEAKLVLELTERPRHDVWAHFLCRGAASARSPVMSVDVDVNGTQLDSWTFVHPDETDANVWRSVVVRADLAASPRVEFVFRIGRPHCPKRAGVDDGRELGIGLAGLLVSSGRARITRWARRDRSGLVGQLVERTRRRLTGVT